MTYVHKVFGLGILLVIVFSVLMVPLALAQEGGTVEVTLEDGQINMVDSLPAGPTTFMITNNGTEEHSFEVEGNGIEEELDPHLQPGENGTLEVDLQPGTYEVYCPMADHRGQGMEIELTVTAATDTTPSALPATGGVLSPGSGILLLGLGVLVLIGGLSLAFARRTR